MTLVAPPWANVYARPGTAFGVVDAAHPNPHRGKDFYADAGTVIVAYCKSQVVNSDQWWAGIGNCVTVKLLEGPNAGKFALWAHIKKGTRPGLITLNPGDTVGVVAGALDAPGTAWTGPHIHTCLSDTVDGGAIGNVWDPGPGIQWGITAYSTDVTPPPPPPPVDPLAVLTARLEKAEGALAAVLSRLTVDEGSTTDLAHALVEFQRATGERLTGLENHIMPTSAEVAAEVAPLLHITAN